MTEIYDSLRENLWQTRTTYWRRIRAARKEYINGEDKPDPYETVTIDSGFYYWMQNKYGIRIEFADGQVSGNYTIVDAPKEMLFRIKFP